MPRIRLSSALKATLAAIGGTGSALAWWSLWHEPPDPVALLTLEAE